MKARTIKKIDSIIDQLVKVSKELEDLGDSLRCRSARELSEALVVDDVRVGLD